MSRAEELWERLVRAALRRERSGIDAFRRRMSGIAGNVPSSLANNGDIDEILRAADENKDEDPNVSRILCEHAYSLPQNLDPNSEGQGVLQFKTGLMSVIKSWWCKIYGGAKYRPTGRGFVVFHAKFAENYRLYSRSHFVKGLELMILLLVFQIFGHSYRSAVAYVLITISMWFMVGAWLFAPLLFNPSGFLWQKIDDDWTDWNKWISNRGGIGVPPEKSWESWWEEEQEHLRYSGKRGIIAEILLALRFFIYQYGLVYHLTITKHTKSFLVYGISWLVIFLILFVMKTVSVVRRKFSANFQLVIFLTFVLIMVTLIALPHMTLQDIIVCILSFMPTGWRLLLTISVRRQKFSANFQLVIFLTFVSILVTLIALPHMTLQDIIVCILAFMPTGWGLLLIAQACKPIVHRAGFWGSVRALARGYEIVMGLLLFTPVAFLAWFPFVSEFQTRMLFKVTFSRGLQISRILGGQRKDRSSRNKE